MDADENPKKAREFKEARVSYPPELIEDFNKSCPKFNAIRNENKKLFVLTVLDHSQIGNRGIADMLGIGERNIYKYQNDPLVIDAIRECALKRSNMCDSRAPAVLDRLMDLIAKKVFKEGFDPKSLSSGEWTFLKNARDRIDPANSTIVLEDVKRITAPIESIDEIMKQHHNDYDPSADLQPVLDTVDNEEEHEHED